MLELQVLDSFHTYMHHLNFNTGATRKVNVAYFSLFSCMIFVLQICDLILLFSSQLTLTKTKTTLLFLALTYLFTDSLALME